MTDSEPAVGIRELNDNVVLSEVLLKLVWKPLFLFCFFPASYFGPIDYWNNASQENFKNPFEYLLNCATEVIDDKGNFTPKRTSLTSCQISFLVLNFLHLKTILHRHFKYVT